MVNPNRVASRLADAPSDEPTSEKRFRRPTDRGLTAAGGEVDTRLLPRGYIAEWKRHSIWAARDTRNMAQVRQYGWVPVTNKMQPHLAPFGANPEEQVTRGSDALYMRPAYLNEEAASEEQSDTDSVLQNQVKALRAESAGHVGKERTFFKKETVAIPADQ